MPEGKLIAVVYRYDPPGGKKEFRPWDAKRRKMAPPEPRPLYNQPGMRAVDTVVLVEGERMLETMRWVQWLEVEQRHLVWMRANRYEWQQIGRRFACDRNTAARRWNKAMEKIADHLCTSATNQLAKTNQVG